MNKRQLASKIGKSTNKTRSKIEAYEYKDYILGFIFYKFLSNQEEEYLKKVIVHRIFRPRFALKSRGFSVNAYTKNAVAKDSFLQSARGLYCRHFFSRSA